MLVQNSVYRNTYLTDGVNKDFYFSFPILEASQVLVQTSLLTNTDTVTTVDPSQYTVTGVGLTTGGHISFNTAPPTGSRIALTLNIPITQLYQYAELDSFPAKSHEDALAKLTLICQQLKEQISRAILMSATSEGSTADFIASLYAARDSAAASAVSAAGSASSAAQAASAAASAAGASTPATSEKAGTIKPGKGVTVASDGTLNVSYWDAFPPFIPAPIWGVTFGGSDGRRAVMPGETSAREDWILCDGGSDGKEGTVPNLVGRVPLGASSSYTAGSTGGSATHEHTVTGNTGATTLSTAQMASHSHTVTAAYRGSGLGYGISESVTGSIANETRTTSTVGSNASHLHSVSVTASATSNMMPYCALHYVIRII